MNNNESRSLAKMVHSIQHFIGSWASFVGYANLTRASVLSLVSGYLVNEVLHIGLVEIHMNKVYGITGDESVAAMAGVVFVQNGFKVVYPEDDYT